MNDTEYSRLVAAALAGLLANPEIVTSLSQQSPEQLAEAAVQYATAAIKAVYQGESALGK